MAQLDKKPDWVKEREERHLKPDAKPEWVTKKEQQEKAAQAEEQQRLLHEQREAEKREKEAKRRKKEQLKREEQEAKERERERKKIAEKEELKRRIAEKEAAKRQKAEEKTQKATQRAPKKQNRKIRKRIIIAAVLAGVVMLFFGNPIVRNVQEAFYPSDAPDYTAAIQAAAKEQKTFAIDNGWFVKINPDKTVSCYSYSFDDDYNAIRFTKLDPNPLRDWRGITAVALDYRTVVGLQDTGRLLEGNLSSDPDDPNEYKYYYYTGIQSTDNKNIIDFSMHYSDVFALKSNGTVINLGKTDDRNKGCDGMREIAAVSAEYDEAVGLKADGSVACSNSLDRLYSFSYWRNIAMIQFDQEMPMGLRKNGTIIHNTKKLFEHEDSWQDIIAFSGSFYIAVGVKNDGTVLLDKHIDEKNVVREREINMEALSDWKDVAAVNTYASIAVCKDKNGVFHLRNTAKMTKNDVGRDSFYHIVNE